MTNSPLRSRTMPLIKVENLLEGQVTEADYYSEKGQLLIAKGEVLTDKHLRLLQRRNIFEIHVHYDRNNTDQTPQLLQESDNTTDQDIFPTDAWNIAVGKEEYEQLLASRSISSLDRAIKFKRISDQPIGKAFRTSMTQKVLSHRPFQYKNSITRIYEESLESTKLILQRLAGGKSIDPGILRAVVERFITLFLNDRNILLAISSQKIDQSDPLYNHVLNVCILSMNIAAASDYSEEQIIQIGMGAILHDLGMLLVPPCIRFKKSRLSDEEWYEIRKHPLFGMHIIDRLVRLPDSVKYIAYQIHERENGKGYPKQRPGRLIHNFAKIAQVADVFDAVSSPRPYRRAFAPFKGIEMIIRMGKQSLLNEKYIMAMLKSVSLFPVGSIVELNDGRRGQVIAANEYRLARPMLSIISDQKGKPLEASDIYILDMASDTSIQVIRSLPFDFTGNDTMYGF